MVCPHKGGCPCGHTINFGRVEPVRTFCEQGRRGQCFAILCRRLLWTARLLSYLIIWYYTFSIAKLKHIRQCTAQCVKSAVSCQKKRKTKFQIFYYHITSLIHCFESKQSNSKLQRYFECFEITKDKLLQNHTRSSASVTQTHWIRDCKI